MRGSRRPTRSPTITSPTIRSSERCTFAVIGHNEAATVGDVVEQCRTAARPGDSVLFVDSASTDESAQVAARAGAEVLPAPLGKGRAVAAAIGWHREGWLILVDADVEESEVSIPAALRDAAARSVADMIVGQVDTPGKRRSVTPHLYEPLVRALFPEAPVLDRPLSGFRALRAGLELGDLPQDYGVEAHLNVQVALQGGSIEILPLGTHRGPIRDYAHIGRAAHDIGDALLDLAVAHGRIADRMAWEAWAARVLAAIDDQPGEGADDTDYFRALRAAAAQPLPIMARPLPED
jgi:glucosyl-3-phosphoglycerate synthase